MQVAFRYEDYGDDNGGFIGGQAFRYAGFISDEGSVGDAPEGKAKDFGEVAILDAMANWSSPLVRIGAEWRGSDPLEFNQELVPASLREQVESGRAAEPVVRVEQVEEREDIENVQRAITSEISIKITGVEQIEISKHIEDIERGVAREDHRVAAQARERDRAQAGQPAGAAGEIPEDFKHQLS